MTTSGDKLFVRGLRLFGRHGVLSAERDLGQLFLVDLEAEADVDKAGRSDDLNDTVNYVTMYEIAKNVIEGPPDQLVERVASRIAYRILSQISAISAIRVRICKPHVALPVSLDAVGVDIYRSRGDLLSGGRLYKFQ